MSSAPEFTVVESLAGISPAAWNILSGGQLLLAERNGLRVHEVPVTWIDDPDSRVHVAKTARDDLRGVLRLVADFGRGHGRADLGPAAREPLADDFGRQVVVFGKIGVLSTLVSLLLFLWLRGSTGAVMANLIAVGSTAVGNTWANRRYTATQDVGRAIHPSYVEGQIQGGAAQGIGWALNEEYVYDKNGKLLNAGLLDYRMPTTLDLPMIDAVMVEVPNPKHPYGVRGVGEVPIVPPAGAIANAIFDATGVRMMELPMSPARNLAALEAAASAAAG